MVDDACTDLKTATDVAIASYDGDARAAVSALLVVLGATEVEITTLKAEVARIETTVSDGYVRKNLRRRS